MEGSAEAPTSTAALPSRTDAAPAPVPAPRRRAPHGSHHTAALQSQLSKEEFRVVADARREVWTGGFKGMAFGLVMGPLAYGLGRRFGGARSAKWTLGKEGLGMAMGGGALFAFVGASARGRSAFGGIDRVLENHSRPVLSPYQQRVQDEQALAETARLQEVRQRVAQLDQHHEARRREREIAMQRAQGHDIHPLEQGGGADRGRHGGFDAREYFGSSSSRERS